MEVRPATVSDLADIESLVASAYRPYVPRIGKPPAPMLDDYSALIDRGVVDVAAEDKLCGVLVHWSEADHHYVDNVATNPSCRGRGVGRFLLDHASSCAVAAGKPELRLYTNTAMTENLEYYPRLGFVETHRETQAGYDRVFFSRRVTGDSL